MGRSYRPSEDIGRVKTAVDLGATIGDSTLAMLIDYNPEKIVAVEMDPTNFGLMQENLERNGFGGQVIAVNKAIYNREGMVGIKLSVNTGHHMATDERRRVNVETVTLRNLLKEAEMEGQIDCFKMDIEGAERLVLTGKNRGTFEGVRYVTMEAHGPELGGENVQDSVNYFQQLGFRVKTRPTPYKGGLMVEAFNPKILDQMQ